MLPKKYRLSLPKKPPITKLEKKQLIQGKYFGLLVTQQETDAESRFAIIISSKVAKKATQRNKVKRLLNEAVRKLLKDTKKGYDVVFLIKKNAVAANLNELQNSVRKAFKKAGLLEITQKAKPH